MLPNLSDSATGNIWKIVSSEDSFVDMSRLDQHTFHPIHVEQEAASHWAFICREMPSHRDKSRVHKVYAGCTLVLAQSPAHYFEDATEQIWNQPFSYELMDLLVRCPCLKFILYFILSLLISVEVLSLECDSIQCKGNGSMHYLHEFSRLWRESILIKRSLILQRRSCLTAAAFDTAEGDAAVLLYGEMAVLLMSESPCRRCLYRSLRICLPADAE